MGAAAPYLLVTVVMWCVASVGTTSCPTACECKWRNGKEAVLCLSRNLTAIPSLLDAGTQVLDLTSNNLMEIGKDAFSDVHLLNLQRVFVANCKIKSLDRYAFRKLKNLIELDLSYNYLLTVPSHVFGSISELRELKLSGNPILRILDDAFNHVPQLVRLEMTDCKLVIVEPRAFNRLENSLEWLKLDKNKLSNIKPLTFTTLHSLHGLELSENPWNCSCSLRDLRQWMLRYNIPSSLSPVCRNPKRVQGKSWDRLNIDDFACLPTVRASLEIIKSVEGDNAVLGCLAAGTPSPEIRWHRKGRILPNISSGLSSSAKRPYFIKVTDKETTLNIPKLELSDAGAYVCSAENNAGKVEANVTLEVSRRLTDTGIMSWNVLLASLLVAVLFVVSSCLIVVCACSARQKHRVQRVVGKESYEMKHKSTSHNSYTGVPRHSDYHGVPPDDGGDEDDTPSTVVSDTKENTEEITRRSSLINRNLYGDIAVQHHVLRKEVLPSGSLYTTATSEDRNYPDLLETSPQPAHSYFFNTLPRRGSRVKQPTVSESQSPLLAESRGGSSGGDSGGSHRLSSVSRSPSYYRLADQRSSSTLNLSHNYHKPTWKHPSLPGSPVGRPNTETPILDLLGQRSSNLTYDYHAAQLERFLQEYQSLQEQLNKMKKTCESIQLEEQPRSILKKRGLESADPYWVPRRSLYTSADFLHS